MRSWSDEPGPGCAECGDQKHISLQVTRSRLEGAPTSDLGPKPAAWRTCSSSAPQRSVALNGCREFRRCATRCSCTSGSDTRPMTTRGLLSAPEADGRAIRIPRKAGWRQLESLVATVQSGLNTWMPNTSGSLVRLFGEVDAAFNGQVARKRSATFLRSRCEFAYAELVMQGVT